MAVFKDWAALAESTAKGLERRAISDLYRLEWPEAKRKLIEQHRPALERIREPHKRAALTASAILYGLANRLAPVRRIIFVLAFAMATAAIVSFLADTSWSNRTVGVATGLIGGFLLMTFLLSLELIDKLKFRDELELARELQEALIPDAPPQHEAWDIDAFNRSANMVGGDLYDFAPLPGGRLGILFGDASGHGMTAGLVMAVAQAAFRTQLEIDAQPEAIAGALNRILCRTGSSRSFFAGITLLLEPDGSYQAIVAGHPPILQLSAEGKIRNRIGKGSYPLGVKAQGAWSVEGGRLEAGDLLLLYSDGLPEAQSRRGAVYGYDRVEAVASAVARSDGARHAVAAIVRDYERHIEGAPAEDDVSVAVVRYRGGSEKREVTSNRQSSAAGYEW